MRVKERDPLEMEAFDDEEQYRVHDPDDRYFSIKRNEHVSDWIGRVDSKFLRFLFSITRSTVHHASTSYWSLNSIDISAT